MVAYSNKGVSLAAVAALMLGVAGCNSTSTGSPSPSPTRELAPGLFSWGSRNVQPDAPVNEDFTCPPITVSDGGAAMRQGATDGASVRLQLSMGQIARECTNIGMDGSFTLKVGVEGRALLGPSGRPGTFNVPVRITVNSDEKPFITRALRTSVSIPGGADSAQFIMIEEGIRVPGGKPDLEIQVGFSTAGGETRARRRR